MFKKGEIIGKIINHLPGGQVEVDYEGTILTMPASDNEQLNYKDGGLLVPNNKKSNLTQAQYHLVRTPAFKAWFGDWENDPANASKVVDENGEPLVVYHGTIKNFTIFDKKFATKNTKVPHGHLGFFFSENFNLAIDFTRKDWTNINSKHKSEWYYAMGCFLNIRNPKITSARGFTMMNTDKSTQSMLITNKYDGVVIEKWDIEDKKSWINLFGEKGTKEFDFKQFAAFYPEQIKLADGSNKQFDSSNPDIRFETGGTINFDNMENFDWEAFYSNLDKDDSVKEVQPHEHYEANKEKVTAGLNYLDNQLFVTENLLKEWQNKNYKKNSSIVYAGGDDIHGAGMSIGSINEARKRKNIVRLEHAIANINKAKELLTNYDLEREGTIYDNMLNDYRRNNYLRPNGKKMSTEQIWQIDEGYSLIFDFIKKSYKRGGQVTPDSNTMFDLNALLGFSIDEFLDTPAKNKKTDTNTGIEKLELKDLYTDEARFQNRDKLNQELVDQIAENWSDADQDPIHIWKDPKKQNKSFVLSGHHRYYGAKKAGRKTVKVIDRTNDFTEDQAIKFAKEEANANRTMETPLERAKALRAKRLRGDSRDEINKFLEREGKNKNYVNNLAYLNPSGKALKMLEQFGAAEDKQLQKETEQRADWIGEARRTILGLTDAHENELFDFLFDKSASKRVSTKAEFLQKVRSVVNPMQPDEPLNIARFKLQTQGEAVYDEMVNEKKAAIADRQDKINKLNDRFNNPYAPDFVSTESPGYDSMRKIADNKISQLDSERKALQKQLEDIYRDKMKYTSATTSGTLFMNFKTGGELLPEANDLLGFSLDEFLDEKTLEKEFGPAPGKIDKSKLQDYGEKIGGAKKDLLRELRTITGTDLETLPLSKAFPAPDYKKLFEDGVINQNGAILLKFMYDEIPAKPRKSYRIPRWVNQVQTVINTFERIIGADAVENKEYAEALIDGIHSSKLLDSRYFMFSETMKGFEFPTNPVNLGTYRIMKFDRGWRLNSEMRKEAVSDKFSIVNGRYIIKDYTSMEEAIFGLKMMLMLNKTKAKTEGTKFSVYQDRYTRDYFIGKKGSMDVIRLVEGFSTGKEAFTFLKDNQEKIQGIWDGMRDIPEERRESNRDRIGADWRKGRDISSEEFGKTFGFRGVEFGNWVNPHERQQNINDAFDALMDLAAITGVTASALSLNGQLAFAFGARGSGKANAHYEPDKVVINLTKTRGAGSLGHEWWHALDNYFSRMRGLKSDHITNFPKYRLNNSTGQPDTSVRFEVLDAYKGVVDAINKSGLPKRSQFLDGPRSKQYWSTIVEMSARSFEGFIIDKLHETSQMNDYLANFKEMGEWVRSTNGNIDAEKNYPYPLDNERAAINEAYQQFFNAIQVKKDDAGKDVIFEKGGQLTGFAEYPLGTKITSTLKNKKGQSYTLQQVDDYKMFLGDKDGLPIQDGGKVFSEKSIRFLFKNELLAQLPVKLYRGIGSTRINATYGSISDDGMGVFYTDNKIMAEWFAGLKVFDGDTGQYEAVVNPNGKVIELNTTGPKKPFIIDSMHPEYNLDYEKDSVQLYFNEIREAGSAENYRKELQSRGFDGIVLKENTTNYYADGTYDVYIFFNDKFESGGEIEDDIPDTKNTGYDARVSTNMQFIGSQIADWRAVPIKGFTLVPGPGDKMVEMPEFDFPKGYSHSNTLYKSSQDSPCCELCGKSPIKIFYHIQNDKEKTTMITGSECVTHFGDGASGKENLRAAKINLAIMMDHDLGILARYIKQNFSYMYHIGYGRQERNWRHDYVGQSESDNNKKYDQIKNDDISILLDPKSLERAKIAFKDEPKYIEQSNYIIDWKYIHSKFPSFGWKNQLDLIKRNYDSQETGEKKLLTWYKKNEHAGRMLLEKVTKILKVLDKFDENVLNSEYLSAVNTV